MIGKYVTNDSDEYILVTFFIPRTTQGPFPIFILYYFALRAYIQRPTISVRLRHQLMSIYNVSGKNGPLNMSK